MSDPPLRVEAHFLQCHQRPKLWAVLASFVHKSIYYNVLRMMGPNKTTKILLPFKHDMLYF
jgi:hypothetical protein